MFCTNCGRKLPDDINFCPFCGTKVMAIPTEEPVADEPVIEGPAVEEPIIEEAIAEEPAAEEPVAEEAVIEEPVIEEPPVEEPVIEEPAVEEVIAEEPVVEEPAAEPPIAEEAAAVEASAVEAATEVTEDSAAVETAAVEAVEETAEESAEAAAAAVAGVEQATEQQPKKRNKGLIAAIIAVLVIAAGVGGYFIYQGLPSTKLAKLRTQISAAIESQDVDGASPLIEQAYEYAPDDPDLCRQYAECSEAILMKSFADGKLEEFIKGTDDLIKDYPEATEVLDPLVEASYKQLANDAVNSGSIPAMQAIKDRLADLHNSGRFNFAKEINWLEDNIQHVDLSNIFKTLAAKMIPLIKSNDRAGVFETIRNELISGSGSAHKLCASSTQAEYHLPLISDPDASGKRLGIYYSGGHYFFYFGEYSGDKRQGSGIWICADNMRTSTSYREYWSEGPWSGDKPNGTFTLSNLSKYATSDKEQLIEGTAEVTDGFYNGKVTYTYDGSVPVTGTYVNGIAQVIMTTDPNGKEANVVMISEDGSAWVSQSNINEKRGIYGYY